MQHLSGLGYAALIVYLVSLSFLFLSGEGGGGGFRLKPHIEVRFK